MYHLNPPWSYEKSLILIAANQKSFPFFCFLSKFRERVLSLPFQISFLKLTLSSSIAKNMAIIAEIKLSLPACGTLPTYDMRRVTHKPVSPVKYPPGGGLGVGPVEGTPSYIEQFHTELDLILNNHCDQCMYKTEQCIRKLCNINKNHLIGCCSKTSGIFVLLLKYVDALIKTVLLSHHT